MKTMTSITALGAVCAMLVANSAQAADAPAVSGINGKAAVIGTYTDANDISGKLDGVFLGSLTAPISHDFGFQADAVLGVNDGDGAAGIGGHLFWRDPAKGLAGLTASYLTVNNVNGIYDIGVARFGGEGEIYLSDITLSFDAGYQDGHNFDDGFYGSATGYWYANDNLRFGIGAANDPANDTTGKLDIEYQPDFGIRSGMTFFAGSTIGKDNLVVGELGVRFYFGQPKSLKLRNREDDPAASQAYSSYTSTTHAGAAPICVNGVNMTPKKNIVCPAPAYTPPAYVPPI